MQLLVPLSDPTLLLILKNKYASIKMLHNYYVIGMIIVIIITCFFLVVLREKSQSQLKSSVRTGNYFS